LGQRELVEWQKFLAIMPAAEGRYAKDKVTDFLVVRSDRAVVFTDLRMLYVSLETRRTVWEAKGGNIISVASVGLALYVTSRERPRIMGRKTARGITLPVRRAIWCSSQNAHASILYKVAGFRAQFASRTASEEGAEFADEDHPEEPGASTFRLSVRIMRCPKGSSLLHIKVHLCSRVSRYLLA
jgi:hypothetical protein